MSGEGRSWTPCPTRGCTGTIRDDGSCTSGHCLVIAGRRQTPGVDVCSCGCGVPLEADERLPVGRGQTCEQCGEPGREVVHDDGYECGTFCNYCHKEQHRVGF